MSVDRSFAFENLQWKVENVIYCIHQGILQAKLVVFNELFETGGEGASDGKMLQKPIFLPQVTSKEFDNLLTFIYNKYVHYSSCRELELHITC